MRYQQNRVSHDERLLSAASHSAALLPVVGFLVPLHIWLTQRDWSKFVQFHALQALVYQMGVPSFLAVLYWLIFVGVFGGLGGEFLGAWLALRCALVLIFAAIWVLYVVWGLSGAVRILAGRDFFYPILGEWIAQQLSDRTAAQDSGEVR
jgi:uncharacterized Tic20 family protein